MTQTCINYLPSPNFLSVSWYVEVQPLCNCTIALGSRGYCCARSSGLQRGVTALVQLSFATSSATSSTSAPTWRNVRAYILMQLSKTCASNRLHYGLRTWLKTSKNVIRSKWKANTNRKNIETTSCERISFESIYTEHWSVTAVHDSPNLKMILTERLIILVTHSGHCHCHQAQQSGSHGK